jgi:peptide/nickel transport system ATP-binding protein
VQIADPDRVMRSYPHELSGGMRQRILIASAFAAEPKLIVADEPTTALDVTVQKQILKLIGGMQARHGTALLFVTHDLGVVSKVCQRLSVLYSGMVVEDTSVCAISFAAPGHPYSARASGGDAEIHRPGGRPAAGARGRDRRRPGRGGGRRGGRAWLTCTRSRTCTCRWPT